jgi:arabinofuranan 3-O-arabinosyltransferase
LSSAGNIRMLDAVEARLESGQASPGLAAYLERMGVRYLVVRNDLAASAQAPLPIRVHQALDGSPGINRVAWFGPIVDRPFGTEVLADEGLRVSYPAVEIFELTASNAPEDPRAVLRPADAAIEVQGSPESLLSLSDLGALGNRPTFLAGDPEATGLTAASGMLTDTDRRREVTFGYMRGNESATMTQDQQYQQSRPVHDYRVFGDAGTTVAVPGLEFDASSSSSDVDATWRQPRGATPAAAMDGALDTYWRPGALNEERSFWEVRYDSAIELGDTVEVALLNRGTKTPTTIPLVVTTANGTTEVDARDFAGWQTLPVAAGQTDFVRVGLADVFRPPLLGIREIRLPGEAVSTLQLPGGVSGDALVLTARPGDAGECAPRDDLLICSDGLGRFSQDRVGLFREVNLASPLTSTPRMLVAPRDGASISERLLEVSGAGVEATSTRTAAVAGSAIAAVDRRLGTTWQAAPDDPAPALTISLPTSRTLRGIRLVNRQGANASSPLELQVQAGDKTYQGFTDGRGLYRFDPVTTDRLEVRFLSSNQVRSRSELGELSLPVGISEIGLIGADDLREPLPSDAVVDMPCGSGPDVLVDGEVVAASSVSARVEQFMDGDVVPARMCGSPVSLPAGPHSVALASSKAFRPVMAIFAQEDTFAPSGRPESAAIETWEPTSRTMRVDQHGDAQVLEVAENFNPGWRATLAGEPLPSVRVDGWKQGFVVPAGASGTVDMDFAPDGAYRWGLLVGLLAALAVLFIAVRPPSVRVRPPVHSRDMARLTAGLVGAGVLLVFGPWGLLAFGLALLVVRRLPLPVVAFTGVALAGALSAAAGIRPGSAEVVLQGCVLVTAWAAILWAGWPRVAGASGISPGHGSSAAPDAR